ncbi:hypothetical protein V5799_021072 [Amblyomma americanum]|uniref:Uncharacterized protein n=1 Tax=Amblyomma americanum TaxID=6943 RepID=A0AAQ4FPG6_AMBAM
MYEGCVIDNDVDGSCSVGTSELTPTSGAWKRQASAAESSPPRSHCSPPWPWKVTLWSHVHNRFEETRSILVTQYNKLQGNRTKN